MIFIALHFVSSFLVGLMGRKRSMGFWGYFFGSLLLSPLIGFLLVIASGKKEDEEAPKIVKEE